MLQINDMTECSLDNVTLIQRRDSSSSNIATPPKSPTLLVSHSEAQQQPLTLRMCITAEETKWKEFDAPMQCRFVHQIPSTYSYGWSDLLIE